MIKRDPDYGQVVCRCGKAARAEILTAVHSPLGVDTMAGIECRTRSVMGRCQEEYCWMRIAQMVEEESGKRETEIGYARKDSQTSFGRV